MNLVDDAATHVVSSGKFLLRDSVVQPSYLTNVRIGQFRKMMRCAARRGRRDLQANPSSMDAVLSGSHPFQVIEAVVEFDPIDVIDVPSFWIGRVLQERLGHQPVNRDKLRFSVDAKDETSITRVMDSAREGAFASIVHQALHAPKIADHVTVKTDGGSPDLALAH